MGKNAGISFVSFLVGAVFGAVIALLYAPSSGEELRAQIKEEADTRVKQASIEWNKAVSNIQKSIDELSGEVRGYFDQLTAQEEVEQTIEEASEPS